MQDLGKDLNPDSIINYIDELQEARLPKAPSNLSLHSDFKHTDTRAKGGVRKTSVSDELQKASEIVDDDDEDAGLELETVNESEALGTTIQKAEDKSTKRIEALERELDAEKAARKAVEQALEAEKKVHKVPIKAGSPQESPQNPSVPWIQSCLPWHGQSLSDGDTGKKLWLYLVGMVLAVAFAHNYYLTWIERSSWLNANRDPTSQFYHEYMAQQSGSIFPLFELEGGPWITWIERDLLGYLEVLPG